jgi:hypothetical protein
MRRLAVIACSLGVLGTLVVAYAPAAQSNDPLEFAIVGIDARIGGDAVHGSGAVIDPDKGLVVTSARLIWGATSLRLTTGVGVLHGRIVARAPCSDVALLEMQPRIPGLVALKGGGTLTRPPDVVVRAADGSVQHLDRPRRLDTSGAPVVDSGGRIAGIADAASGRSAVVPWPLIDERLSELRPGPRRIYVGWRGEYTCTPGLNAYAKARHPGFRARDAVLNAPVPATRVPGTEELDR